MERLRKVYTTPIDHASRRGSKDVLSPLTGPHEARHRSSSMARRRTSTSNSHQPSMFAFGINPFPRRTATDLASSNRLEPLSRVNLTITQARDARAGMLADRAEVVEGLQSMIHRIDALMKQKDAVRQWTKLALESNRILRATMDSLNAEVVGNNRARMRRLRDQMIDLSLRQGVGQLFKIVYRVWYLVMWFVSWRTPSARRNLREDQKGWRGVPWGTTCAILLGVLVVVVFYRLGE